MERTKVLGQQRNLIFILKVLFYLAMLKYKYNILSFSCNNICTKPLAVLLRKDNEHFRLLWFCTICGSPQQEAWLCCSMSEIRCMRVCPRMAHSRICIDSCCTESSHEQSHCSTVVRQTFQTVRSNVYRGGAHEQSSQEK